ncbi:MAG: hypothetical protein Q8O19_04015, partial [Rectinemataceae bacterium]|nr:hypothetical protein [Rectinemataceae bacterium]
MPASFHIAIANSKDDMVFYVNGVPHPLYRSLDGGLIFSSLRVNQKAIADLSVIVAGKSTNRVALIEACRALLAQDSPKFSSELMDEEKAFWGIDDAWSRNSSTRTELCLNGIWRFEPFSPLVSTAKKLYSKIPGRWLSQNMYNVFELNGGEKRVVKEINGVSLGKIRGGVYSRSLIIPDKLRDKKLILQCKNIGADCARVFANGEFVGAVSATGKFDQGLMKGFAFEIPSSSDTNSGRLDIAVELHFQGEGNRAGGSSLLDVSLLAVPVKTRLEDISINANPDSSKITISGSIVDIKAAGEALNINCVIKDKSGNELKRFSAPLEGVSQNGGYSFSVSTIWPEIPRWSAEFPNIMSADIALQSSDGVNIDEIFPLRLGVRKFETEKDHFTINGIKTRLFYNSSVTGTFFIRYNNYILGDGVMRNILTKLKSAGYNTIGLDIIYNKDMVQWYNHQTPDYHERFLDLCDELGLYVVLHTPEFDEFIDEIEYRRAIAEIASTWGAHPSVIMYLTDFNKTWYAMGQHPAMINDFSYLPEFKRSARQFAL